MDFKENTRYISHEDIFARSSRWNLFWNFVIKRKGIKLTWSFSPTDTVSDVYIDWAMVVPIEGLIENPDMEEGEWRTDG